jgi:hypothetical protein
MRLPGKGFELVEELDDTCLNGSACQGLVAQRTRRVLAAAQRDVCHDVRDSVSTFDFRHGFTTAQ